MPASSTLDLPPPFACHELAGNLSQLATPKLTSRDRSPELDVLLGEFRADLLHQRMARDNLSLEDVLRAGDRWLAQFPFWPSRFLIVVGREACTKTGTCQSEIIYSTGAEATDSITGGIGNRYFDSYKWPQGLFDAARRPAPRHLL